jgi:hypothetical protein
MQGVSDVVGISLWLFRLASSSMYSSVFEAMAFFASISWVQIIKRAILAERGLRVLQIQLSLTELRLHGVHLAESLLRSSAHSSLAVLYCCRAFASASLVAVWAVFSAWRRSFSFERLVEESVEERMVEALGGSTPAVDAPNAGEFLSEASRGAVPYCTTPTPLTWARWYHWKRGRGVLERLQLLLEREDRRVEGVDVLLLRWS